MSFYGSTDFMFEVAKGNVPGHEIVTINSTNPALVGTSDIWDLATPLVYPTAVETLELVTTGVDTIAGTGAQKITTVYLDSSYNELTTITDTNAGTTAIATTNFFRHQRSFVSQAGTGDQNANNIDIQVTGGGAIRGRILAPSNVALPSNTTRASHYTVPLGKSISALQFYVDSRKGDDVSIEVYTTKGASNIFRPVFPMSVYQSTSQIILRGSQLFEEKSEIKAVGSILAGTYKISFVMQMVLMDNAEVNNA